MKKIFLTLYPWKITPLSIAATDKGVCCINFSQKISLSQFISTEEIFKRENGILLQAIDELDKYFSGKMKIFTVPVDLCWGTSFQRAVWEYVRSIPYGKVKTYGQIARDLGRPKGARAVGNANGANPIPVIVPCHRVVQSDGKLGGYGGGLDVKDSLLRLEGVLL